MARCMGLMGLDSPTSPATLLPETAPSAPAAWQPLALYSEFTQLAGALARPPQTQAPEIIACSARILSNL